MPAGRATSAAGFSFLCGCHTSHPSLLFHIYIRQLHVAFMILCWGGGRSSQRWPGRSCSSLLSHLNANCKSFLPESNYYPATSWGPLQDPQGCSELTCLPVLRCCFLHPMLNCPQHSAPLERLRESSALIWNFSAYLGNPPKDAQIWSVG